MRRMFPALSLAMAMPALAGCSMFRMAEAPQAQVTLRVADAALASGAPDVALRIATLVLQKHPDNIAALVAKGDALYAVGAVEQARAAYSLAVAADAGDVGAQIGLGRTLVRSDPHAAETHFIAAAANQTDNVIALNDLGIARDMQGHHAEAQQAYRQALAVMPDMADVKTNLDLSLSLSGEGRQAVQVLEKIVTASEATPLDRADLAMAQNDAGPAGPVKEQVVQTATTHYDTEPIAIMPALITSVESRPLEPRQPGPVAKPEAMVRPAPPPTAPRQTKVVAEGIYVQMASLDSEQAARTEWQKLRTRWPDLLGNRGPSVMQADVHDRKFWRLRTGGFPSVGEANDFCAKLRAAGSGCWTVGPASKS